MLAVAVLAGLTACSSPQKEEQKKLNIVFIMTDDHTTQALSAYDKRFISTPNLDRLADEGIKFNNCFVTNGSYMILKKTPKK